MMTRRTFLSVAAGGLLSCARAARLTTHEALAAASAPITSVSLGPITLHAIQTGWVQVKEAHRTLTSPAALRLPAIALDGDWTPWLPVHAWLIEHPEGLILVDTGERHEAMRADFYDDVDRGNAFFYRRFLRFRVEPEEELGAQLERLGLRTSAIERVVMTHLHSDHADGMHHVAGAMFYIGEAEHDASLPGNLGPKWPPQMRVTRVRCEADDTPGLGSSYALTQAGDIRIVPTPGHSAGHQSVWIRAGERQILLAGDASFDDAQLIHGQLAGICADVARARASLEGLRTLCRAAPTIYLPTHDPDAARRLRQLETTR